MSPTKIFLLDEQVLFRQSIGMLIRASETLDLVGEASSVPQAMDRLAQSPADVLLSSTTLPGRNAFHAVRVLRARFPRLNIAFLDAYPVEIHARQALKAGALGYFTRCDSFQSFEENVQSVARGEQTISAELSGSAFDELEMPTELKSISDSQLSLLTARELEVLKHLAEGLSVRQSAEKLQLAQSTVDNHKSRLMRKLNVHKAAELTRIAIREGLVNA